MEFTRIWKMKITFWKQILTTSPMIHGREGEVIPDVGLLTPDVKLLSPGCDRLVSGIAATLKFCVKYIGYMVENLVLQQRTSRAVKCDFRPYIKRYTFPNENFEYGYSILMYFCSFVFSRSLASYIKLHVIQRNVMLLVTSNRDSISQDIYCRKIFDVIQSDAMLQKHVH